MSLSSPCGYNISNLSANAGRSQPLAWSFHQAVDAFPRFRNHWDQLNRSQHRHLLLDACLVEALLRFYGTERTLLGVENEASPQAMLVVDRSRAGFWTTFVPSQAPLAPVLLNKSADPFAQCRRIMAALPGYAVAFSVTNQDPSFSPFEGTEASGTVERVDYIRTARLTIAGSFTEYWKSLSKNLTHNLSRQQRRLAEQGVQLKLVEYRRPDDMSPCVARYGSLESTGWKAQGSTAISPDNTQGAFYSYLLEQFCRRGEGVVYELQANGQVIASDLCLERDGTLIVLKTTYDETLKGLSPGLLLHLKMFDSLFAQKRIGVVEFYGRVLDWHTKWTRDIRQMYHLNIYRHAWVAHGRRLVKSVFAARQGNSSS